MENGREAGFVKGIRIRAASSLQEVISHLKGEKELQLKYIVGLEKEIQRY